MAVCINECHRRLAAAVFLNIKNGTLCLGEPELRAMIPLLIQNMDFVIRVDELKALALEAQAAGDLEWRNDLFLELDKIEIQSL